MSTFGIASFLCSPLPQVTMPSISTIEAIGVIVLLAITALCVHHIDGLERTIEIESAQEVQLAADTKKCEDTKKITEGVDHGYFAEVNGFNAQHDAERVCPPAPTRVVVRYATKASIPHVSAPAVTTQPTLTVDLGTLKDDSHLNDLDWSGYGSCTKFVDELYKANGQ